MNRRATDIFTGTIILNHAMFPYRRSRREIQVLYLFFVAQPLFSLYVAIRKKGTYRLFLHVFPKRESLKAVPAFKETLWLPLNSHHSLSNLAFQL